MKKFMFLSFLVAVGLLVWKNSATQVLSSDVHTHTHTHVHPSMIKNLEKQAHGGYKDNDKGPKPFADVQIQFNDK